MKSTKQRCVKPGSSGQGKNNYFFKGTPVQRKSKIDQGDIYEREADIIASRIVRPDSEMTQSFFQPKPAEVITIQKEAPTSPGVNTVTPSVNQTLNSAGQPMDAATRNFMEARFGHDFANVRIHNDSLAHRSAAHVDALAYTFGNHVVFGAGEYQSKTINGKQLIAHELVHVVQQNKVSKSTIMKKRKSRVINKAWQRTADDICGFGRDYDILTKLIDKYVRDKWNYFSDTINPDFEAVKNFVEDVIIFKLSDKGERYDLCCPSNLAHFLGMIEYFLPKDHWTTIRENQKGLKLFQSFAQRKWVTYDMGPNEDYLLHQKLVKAIDKAIDSGPRTCLLEIAEGYKMYGKDDSPVLVPYPNTLIK